MLVSGRPPPFTCRTLVTRNTGDRAALAVRPVDNIAVLWSVLKCMKFSHLGACGAFRFIGIGIRSEILQKYVLV